jgi:branched-chain amino acid transport system permease protein
MKAAKTKPLTELMYKITDHPVGKILLPLLIMGLAALVPMLVKSEYWIRVLVMAMVYMMMGLGLNVMLGYTGLLNLGYAAYFAIGAYMWGILASPKYNLHWNFWVVFFLAGLAAGIVAIFLAIPGLKMKGDYLVLITIAFGESIRILANNLDLTGKAIGIYSIDPMTLFGRPVTKIQTYYYVLLIMVAVLLLFMKRLESSRIGFAWNSIRDDDMAAESMGLDTKRLKLLSCFVAAIPAGMAGVLFGALQTYVSPNSFTFTESLLILATVVIGGQGNAFGVVLGTLIVIVLPEPLRGSAFDSARMLIYGLLLIVMMLFRSQGIWPHVSRQRNVVIEVELPLEPLQPEAVKDV